jgi:nucleoside-diphosphate-sugar epimerase
MPAPEPIRTTEELEELLSRPTESVIEQFGRREGDVILLGAGGKIGPSLTRMAWRACQAAGVKRTVYAVSRFSDRRVQSSLEGVGVRTLACDLLDRTAVQNLPDAADVLYLPGMKFGSSDQVARTWAMNTYLPALICERYQRSRIVAFSTGNIYGLTPVAGGGSQETDTPQPLGEYAITCLGRERMFEYFSDRQKTPVTLVRLNYACELRYGVLVDLARRIQAGEAIPLDMGYFNVIWQADSNAAALQSFRHAASPPFVVNISGADRLSVREVATQLGQRLGKSVRFTGAETATALLSQTTTAQRLFGPPTVGIHQMIDWVADWVARGGEHYGKPTHFEVRDGSF